MGRRRRRAPPRPAVGTDPHHPLHPSLEDHAQAVYEGLEIIANEKPLPKSVLPVKWYWEVSRSFHMRLSPYLPVTGILADVQAKQDQEQIDGTGYEFPPFYIELLTMMPGDGNRFEEMLRMLHLVDVQDKTQRAIELFDILDDACHDARCDLTKDLKKDVILYVQAVYGALTPPISITDKAARGFNHTQFGDLIVGIKYRAVYRRGPTAYCEDVRNGTRRHRNDSLPSFLFPQGLVYDPKKPEMGLGEGEVFLSCLRHWATGRSTALGGPSTSPNRSNAEKWGIVSITPYLFASAACQAYVSISSMSEWGDRDGRFNVEKLHSQLVKLLKDPDFEDILDAVSHKVPGLPTAARRPIWELEDDADDSGSEGIDPIEEMKRLRKEAASAAPDRGAPHQGDRRPARDSRQGASQIQAQPSTAATPQHPRARSQHLSSSRAPNNNSMAPPSASASSSRAPARHGRPSHGGDPNDAGANDNSAARPEIRPTCPSRGTSSSQTPASRPPRNNGNISTSTREPPARNSTRSPHPQTLPDSNRGLSALKRGPHSSQHIHGAPRDLPLGQTPPPRSNASLWNPAPTSRTLLATTPRTRFPSPRTGEHARGYPSSQLFTATPGRSYFGRFDFHALDSPQGSSFQAVSPGEDDDMYVPEGREDGNGYEYEEYPEDQGTQQSDDHDNVKSKNVETPVHQAHPLDDDDDDDYGTHGTSRSLLRRRRAEATSSATKPKITAPVFQTQEDPAANGREQSHATIQANSLKPALTEKEQAASTFRQKLFVAKNLGAETQVLTPSRRLNDDSTRKHYDDILEGTPPALTESECSPGPATSRKRAQRAIVNTPAPAKKQKNAAAPTSQRTKTLATKGRKTTAEATRFLPNRTGTGRRSSLSHA